jgi:hypothetical protein
MHLYIKELLNIEA